MGGDIPDIEADLPDIDLPDDGMLFTGFVRVPVTDITIAEAKGQVSDPERYVETMPLVLAGFPQITVADYWALTVAEHDALVRYVEAVHHGR